MSKTGPSESLPEVEAVTCRNNKNINFTSTVFGITQGNEEQGRLFSSILPDVLIGTRLDCTLIYVRVAPKKKTSNNTDLFHLFI